jgi:hypothetical protein
MAWSIPIGIYVLWFVSPKPDHYLLPLMVPMASAVLAWMNGVQPWLSEKSGWKQYAGWGSVIVFAVFITPQIIFHLTRSFTLFMKFFV